MKEIRLPELAESVVEGEIMKWLVAEGDVIAAEQPLCEVMTDKVTVELPSPVAGILRERLAQEGDVVAVHAVIARIEESGNTAASAPASPPPADPEPAPPPQAPEDTGGSIVEAGHRGAQAEDPSHSEASLFKAFASNDEVKVQGLGLRGAPGQATGATTPPSPPSGGRVLAVPAARQLARELGVDLGVVPGSGPNGRVRVGDVLAFHGQSAGAPNLADPSPAPVPPIPSGSPISRPPVTPPPLAPAPERAAGGGLPVAPVAYRSPKGYEHLEERVPLRGMRRAISQQMQASHLYTVRTLTVDEVNMTRLVEFRERMKAETSAAGLKLSYLPFIFKAVAAALKKYPSLNTSFDEATQEIVQKRYYHLGMAVATPAGLTVPVIRDVDRRSVAELARSVVDLAERANSGKLGAEELTGSCFSVTNIGSIGALFSFPIINVPDAAILGVHSIVKRPIVDEHDQIRVAHMMYLSLSFDHRLVDGADAARFCKEVIRLLENPDRLLIEGI